MQMLSGKAVARALRDYFLVAAALEVLLLKQVLPGHVIVSNVSENYKVVSDNDVNALTELYTGCFDKCIDHAIEAVE